MATQINNEFFYDWCFFYNPYENLWYAVSREYKDLYFSNKDKIPTHAVIKNKSSQDILKYLTELNENSVRKSNNTHRSRRK